MKEHDPWVLLDVMNSLTRLSRPESYREQVARWDTVSTGKGANSSSIIPVSGSALHCNLDPLI
jgi:hypothetical protein